MSAVNPYERLDALERDVKTLKDQVAALLKLNRQPGVPLTDAVGGSAPKATSTLHVPRKS
jgi:hypothetical protein